MGTEFVSRKDISVLTGLGKAAVARLVELPEFPSGTWINSRVVIYPKKAVMSFLTDETRGRRRPRKAIPRRPEGLPSRFNIITETV